jgi:cell volume regulation protein A
MFESFNVWMFLITMLVAISILSTRVSYRAGAPILLVVLFVGLLAGEDGIGGIKFDDGHVAFVIGNVALALILFDAGFGTPKSMLKLAAAPALVLAIVGVLLTMVLFAIAAYGLLGFTPMESLLLGAIVASTDAAAVFYLLRVGGVNLRERVRSILEIESGSNDPVAVLLTTTLVGLVQAGAMEVEADALGLAFAVAVEMAVGAAMGVAGGHAIRTLVNRLELEGALYPLLFVATALALFALTNLLHGSGFLAVYAAGLIAGNSRIRRRRELSRFSEGLTWLAQIAMFLTLGLLATPSEFIGIALPALGLGFFLILVARPVAVYVCLRPFRIALPEIAFIGFIGLRGAVSILLALLPLLAGLEAARAMFNVTFIVVLVSLVVQGWGLKPLAHALKLVVPQRRGPVDRIHLELPDEGAHELVAYRLASDSPLLTDPHLPRWVRPALVVRDGRSIRHLRVGRLQPGDTIYVFVRPHRVPLLDRMVASPRSPDHDDREFFGDFTIDPSTPVLELAEFYGADIHAHSRDGSVREFLEREFGSAIEVGDRIGLGTIELVVREIDAARRVVDVGMSILSKTRA